MDVETLNALKKNFSRKQKKTRKSLMLLLIYNTKNFIEWCRLKESSKCEATITIATSCGCRRIIVVVMIMMAVTMTVIRTFIHTASIINFTLFRYIDTKKEKSGSCQIDREEEKEKKIENRRKFVENVLHTEIVLKILHIFECVQFFDI